MAPELGDDSIGMDDGRVARTIRAQRAAMPDLMRLPNVVGTATGLRFRGGRFTDEICVHVYVSEKVGRGQLADLDLVPATVQAGAEAPVPTDVFPVGKIVPLVDPDREPYRPVPGGCSISDLTKRGAGTLGGLVIDPSDGELVLLTCNHVLCPPNDMTQAPADPRILQPAFEDFKRGMTVDKQVIGRTKRVVPILTSPTRDTAPPNPVDAAIGSASEELVAVVTQIEVPAVLEWTTPTVPDPESEDERRTKVMKRGRTTRKTTNGVVSAVNTSFIVPYGTDDKPAWAQIGEAFGLPSVFLITHPVGDAPFAEPGDSGAVVFSEQEGRLGPLSLGLLFAASQSENLPWAWACTIESVIPTLGVSPICSYVEAEVAKSANRGPKPAPPGDASLEQTKRRLRWLWDEALPESPVGREVIEIVRRHASELMLALAADPDLIDRAGDLIRAWLSGDRDADLLDALVDDEKVEALARLVPQLAPAISREGGDELHRIARLIAGVRGTPVRGVLHPK
jgi:hypothetical protein